MLYCYIVFRHSFVLEVAQSVESIQIHFVKLLIHGSDIQITFKYALVCCAYF